MRSKINGLFILSVLAGCVVVRDQKLTYRNTFELKSNVLRTSGYFAHLDSLQSEVSEKRLFTAFIFYSNGTVGGMPDTYYGGESQFMEDVRFHRKAESKLFWGAYKIDSDTIKIQSYFQQGENNFASVWEVREDWGLIVNDTTVLMFDWRVRGKLRKQRKVYRFKSYDSIPDAEF